MEELILKGLSVFNNENKVSFLCYYINSDKLDLIDTLSFSDYEQLIYSFEKDETLIDCKKNIYKSLEELLGLCRTYEQQQTIEKLMIELNK